MTTATDHFAGLDVDPLEQAINGTTKTTQPPASYKPNTFEESCPKCRGTGRFTGWSGRGLGQCFACNGAGKKVFKTSTEQRAKARQSAADKKADKIEAFKTEYHDVWSWMADSSFPPAQQMLADLMKYGSLFDSRIEFARRMIQKRADAIASREAVRQEVLASAPIVGDALQKAFDHAKEMQAKKAKGERGTRRPVKLFFGAFRIAEARKHPGTLYVNGLAEDKSEDQYFGKVVGGKFLKSRECPDAIVTQVAEILADPKSAAIKFGQRSGICCVCGAGLTNHTSIDAGIGPICAEKMGW